MKKAIAIAALCLLVAGCQSEDSSTTAVVRSVVTPNPVIQPAPTIATTNAGVAKNSCTKELNALRRVDFEGYQNRSTQLNHLMTEADIYMQLREKVSPEIHQIMDAAYQFRISKTCNQIRTDLTNALIQRVVGA